MVTTELGACEWFVWDLRRSNLIDRGRLDQIVGEFLQKNPRAEPPALAEFLIAQGILTPFQSERLLQGKTQGFVLGPFTLMDALGVGSMGTVYKALSKTDNQCYAVKVLPRRSMWNVRIARRKVRAFEACRHPSVVPFVDVGISCLLAETEGESLVDTMSTANSVASGLDCASPESIMDPTNLSPLGDQYSLGCVMYFCLTGRYPFPDGTAAEKMMAHQFKEPTPLRELGPEVPGELIEIVE